MHIVIIGGGVGGLAAACLLGKAGNRVTLLEKNEQLGGRAGQLKAKGFTFDTGPSWYLMPEVFEHFFTLLGENVHDHLTLSRLSPSFRVRFAGEQTITITGKHATDAALFETIEPGAGAQFTRFTRDAASLYATAMKTAKQDVSSLAGLMLKDLTSQSKLLLTPMHRYVQRYFRDPRLQKIVEYPLAFLGANPYRAPALYGLLNHALLNQGVFYPKGGMYELVHALVHLGTRFGVTYRTNANVERIVVESGRASAVIVDGTRVAADAVISNTDIWHTETALLETRYRDHTARYWRSRSLAPSALLLYLGVDRVYDSLAHHNVVLGRDWPQNFYNLEAGETFPADPSFYVCAPGKTDPGVAPKGKENLFVLVPVTAGLSYSRPELTAFANTVLTAMENELQLTGLQHHIMYKKLFCVQDFAERFNSLQGTGLGLAHTLRQSAFLRPKNTSAKVKNLYYVGANTHPGIGLPPVLISAELIARQLDVVAAARKIK